LLLEGEGRLTKLANAGILGEKPALETTLMHVAHAALAQTGAPDQIVNRVF